MAAAAAAADLGNPTSRGCGGEAVLGDEVRLWCVRGVQEGGQRNEQRHWRWRWIGEGGIGTGTGAGTGAARRDTAERGGMPHPGPLRHRGGALAE